MLRCLQFFTFDCNFFSPSFFCLHSVDQALKEEVDSSASSSLSSSSSDSDSDSDTGSSDSDQDNNDTQPQPQLYGFTPAVPAPYVFLCFTTASSPFFLFSFVVKTTRHSRSTTKVTTNQMKEIMTVKDCTTTQCNVKHSRKRKINTHLTNRRETDEKVRLSRGQLLAFLQQTHIDRSSWTSGTACAHFDKTTCGVRVASCLHALNWTRPIRSRICISFHTWRV